MRAIPNIALSHARELAYKAALTGSEAAHLHGDCEQPRIIEMRGQESLLTRRLAALNTDPFLDWTVDEKHPRFLPGRALAHQDHSPRVQTVWAKVRCRKCPRCLRSKQRQWTAKAIAEVRIAHRTWFGTLTVGPDRRLWARMSAEKLCWTARSESFGMLTPSERTKYIAKFTSPEVTRFIKRVRKASGVSLRYLLVVEPHKDNFPHYHLLIHETDAPVTKRELQGAWKWGFSQFKLLNPDEVAGVRYACKYLTKDVQTRVRASCQYGQISPDILQRRLADATKEVRGKGRIPPVCPGGKRG